MHMLVQASRNCKSNFSNYYNTIAGAIVFSDGPLWSLQDYFAHI